MTLWYTKCLYGLMLFRTMRMRMPLKSKSKSSLTEKKGEVYICPRCSYKWISRLKKGMKPKQCPRCRCQLDWGRWKQ